jgi:dUTP pyrophosphatase
MTRSDFLACRIVRLPHGDGLELPTYQTEGAAGMDLQAAIPEDEPVKLEVGARRLIPCGFKVEVPVGYVALVYARSGNALKAGLAMANGVGVIDSDYRGEVGIMLINHGESAVGITRGLRLAQLLIKPVARVVWDEVGALEDTARGAGGFGSTGVR